ncbi:MAG: Ig-like domain-containing protein [Candidatus Kerfeldbacteria bacterium]
MKKNIFSKKSIILVIFISCFLIANIFLFNVDYLGAQGATNPPPTSEIDVFLTQPAISATDVPIIYGQSEFIMNFFDRTGSDPLIDLSHFGLEVFESISGPSLGFLDIIGSHWHDPEQDWTWHVRADTMTFDNGNYYIKIHAYSNNGEEYSLNNSVHNGIPIFGLIHFQNDSVIIQPYNNAIVESTTAFSASLLGLVEWVSFFIYSTDTTNGTTETVIVTTPENNNGVGTPSYWNAEWDSTKLVNGSYVVELNYQTIGGIIKNDVASRYFEINNTIVRVVEPSPCEPTNWTCDDWPTECPSTEILTRTCISTDCPITETKIEEQVCIYIDSSTNTNTSIPTNTNTSTNIPLPSTTPPIINMRYPSQGDTVSGAVILKARVQGSIDQLSFVYRNREAGIENHIGQATVSTTNDEIWQRPWNTDDIPSGEYYVFARGIVDGTYSYQSNFTLITIDHNSDNTIIPDPQEDIPDEFINDDGDVFSNTDEGLLNLNPNVPNEINASEDIDAIIDQQVIAGDINQEQAKILKEKYSKIVFDQPTKSGQLASEKLKVNKVDNISPKIGTNNLVFSGIGPPNSYVTIYIYSDPIVVTTKTDENGNFTYTLDKNLLDGEHEVYVTITDDNGKIQEKSAPFTFFVRRAQAVTEEEYLRGDVNIDTDRSEVVNNFILPALIMVGVLVLVFGGVFVANRKKQV